MAASACAAFSIITLQLLQEDLLVPSPSLPLELFVIAGCDLNQSNRYHAAKLKWKRRHSIEAMMCRHASPPSGCRVDGVCQDGAPHGHLHLHPGRHHARRPCIPHCRGGYFFSSRCSSQHRMHVCSFLPIMVLQIDGSSTSPSLSGLPMYPVAHPYPNTLYIYMKL